MITIEHHVLKGDRKKMKTVILAMAFCLVACTSGSVVDADAAASAVPVVSAAPVASATVEVAPAVSAAPSVVPSAVASAAAVPSAVPAAKK